MLKQFCHCKIVGASKVWLRCLPSQRSALTWTGTWGVSRNLKADPEHIHMSPLVSKGCILRSLKFCAVVMILRVTVRKIIACSPEFSVTLSIDFYWPWGVGVGDFLVCNTWFLPLIHSKHTATENTYSDKCYQLMNCCALGKPSSPLSIASLIHWASALTCTTSSLPSGQHILLAFFWSFLIPYHFRNQLIILHEEKGTGYPYG